MNIIASVDKNWSIGNKNKLLVQIPQDMKFFREKTIGKIIVMGRKTLESLPNGMPLTGRTNIVLSHNPGYRVRGAAVIRSIDALHMELGQYDSRDIYLIGGESIYRQLLDECDTAYITKVEYEFEADARFPDLDGKAEWQITAKSGEQTYFDLEYRYYKYEKIHHCNLGQDRI